MDQDRDRLSEDISDGELTDDERHPARHNVDATPDQDDPPAGPNEERLPADLEDNEEEFDLEEIAGREANNAWQLPGPLARYFNKNSRQYVSSEDLSEWILNDFPCRQTLTRFPP